MTSATTTTGDVPQDVASETHEWTVLKRREGTHATQGKVWDDCGSYDSASEWSIYPADLAAIAKRGGGAGEYLCICGQRCERVVIAADTVYRRVEES